MGTSIVNLKTGAAVLKRLQDIYDTPVMRRRQRWGRGWAWDLVNGATRIRDEFPDLEAELNVLQGATKTLDDLASVGISMGAG